MRVLMLTPYVTINSRPEFSRNKTGFGYMVYDIAQAVGVTEQVDVLASDTKGQAFEIDGVRFLKRSVGLFFINFFRCLSPCVVWKLWRRYRMNMGALIRLVYYWFISGYYRKVIKTGHYDVVHIHGCGFSTELWVQICKRCGQKFVVTLHGLNSFSDTVRLEPAGKQYERDFLQRVTQGEMPITVISTGMKRLIEQTYQVPDCPSISVVCNSFSFPDNDVSVFGGGIRRLYNLSDNCRIIVCVGNVCRRKNQGQLIRAFDLLPPAIANQTYFLFLGGNIENDYTIERLSSNSIYKDHFIACGVVEKSMVPNYYAQSDAVALMSLSEGFGLSLIEGMHFGKPSMSFTDVDAFADIYHPEAMIGVKEHSDEAVARGIEELLTKNWDSNRIKDYSKKFESHTMAQKYIKAYKQ